MSLEQKIKTDWKQLIPVYGLYQSLQDYKVGKPVYSEKNGFMLHAYSLYQGICLAPIPLSVLIGVMLLIK